MQIKKWKETVSHGVTVSRMPAGVACKECSGRKQKCFLLELSRKRGKKKQAMGGREDELQASRSRERVSGVGEGVLRPPGRSNGLRR